MAQFVYHKLGIIFFTFVMCSPTLNVYCDIISGHTHKQLNCSKPLPRGISRNFRKQNFMIVFTPLHCIHLAQLCIHGNRYPLKYES